MRMLKMLLVLLFTGGLQLTVVARGNGQEKRLTVNVSNASLETVFNIVRKQSSYLFIFRDENLASVDTKVTLRLKDATIGEVMERCLEGSPLSYRIVDNTVILVKRGEGKAFSKQQVRLTRHGQGTQGTAIRYRA